MPRIFGLVRAAIARGEHPDDPRNPVEYRLGAGHVRFFYPRLGWLARRQAALIAEMLARGHQPTFTNPEGLTEGIDARWTGDWQPDAAALALNRDRIATRLAESAERQRLKPTRTSP